MQGPNSERLPAHVTQHFGLTSLVPTAYNPPPPSKQTTNAERRMSMCIFGVQPTALYHKSHVSLPKLPNMMQPYILRHPPAYMHINRREIELHLSSSSSYIFAR